MSGYRVTTGVVRDSRYPLHHDYLRCYDRVAPLFDYSPHEAASFARRARELRDFDGDRAAVAAHLEESNRALGAPPPTLAACRRLAEPGAVVVIGGQQPGVLAGPLYTFWKAVAAIQLAEALSRELSPQIPVIPVFWIGAEDHDRDEVASVHVPSPDGRVVRIVYDPDEAGRGEAAETTADRAMVAASPFPPRTSVGYLPTGRAAEAFLSRVATQFWATEFTSEIMTILRETAAASGNLGDWFGRLLLGLLGERGLVVANPLHPDLRALQRPMFRRLIRENASTSATLAASQEKVRALGYEPQVDKDPAAANLYLYRGFERIPLHRRTSAGGTYRFVAGPAGGAGRPSGVEDLTVAELDDIAVSHPERLSPNVVLRPLTQDAVLPVLAYVGGPGETSYYALYRELFHHFGRRLPIIYPRPQVAIIERVVGQRLERSGLGPEAAMEFEAVRRAKAAYLEEVDPIGIDEVFTRLETRVREAHLIASETLSRVDPSLAALAAKNLARLNLEIDWLKGKTQQQHRQNCRDAVRRFDSIEMAFRPLGDYQERVFGIFPYLAKYGLALAASLAALPLVPPDGALDPDHRFVWL
jgi:bacillithiol biosynthesis cysteine-adding enzyme BshC